MALPLKKGEGAKLLSLDGGGIKGISSLLILEAIMDKVKEIENGTKATASKKARLPVDYFHLAAGTSTGGIIALMLMRLRMSVEDAITEYNAIGPLVFGEPATSGEAQFPKKPLEDAIDDVVSRYDKVTKEQLAKDTKPLPTSGKKPQPAAKLEVPQVLLIDDKAKMFMCSTLRGRGESVLLRSYPMPEYGNPVSQEGKELYEAGAIANIIIRDAVRATSAAPTYFPPLEVYGKNGAVTSFWDGGLLNNNPIDQLWRARLDLVGPEDPPPKVACVLSLGTSWSSAVPPGFLTKWPRLKKVIDWIVDTPWVFSWIKEPIANLMAKIAPAQESIPYLTNTEARHLDFRRYINRMYNRGSQPEAQIEYFRFNTPTDGVYIDMADYKKMKTLSKITRDWLKTDGAAPWVEKVANILAKKST